MSLPIDATIGALFSIALFLGVDKIRNYDSRSVSIEWEALANILRTFFSVALGALISLYITIKFRLTDLIFDSECTGPGVIRNDFLSTECSKNSCALCDPTKASGQIFELYSYYSSAIMWMLILTAIIVLLLVVTTHRNEGDDWL